MQHVRGEYVIFADADGASKFDDLGKLEGELKKIERDGLGIAVGSRAHMVHSAAVVQVPPTSSVYTINISEVVHSQFHHVCISYVFTFHWHSGYQGYAVWIQVVYSSCMCHDFPIHAC